MRISTRLPLLFLPVALLVPACASAGESKSKKELRSETVERAAAKRPRNLVKLTQTTPLFGRKAEERRFFRNHRREHRSFGLPRYQRKYRKTPYRKSNVDQRSDRKRLYDHNILLRGLFAGRIEHKKYGNLKTRFVGAAMADIGSAVMYAEGAPTVRDLHEDKLVRPHLGALIATDINVKGARVMDKFRKSGRKYPFVVREIPTGIYTAAQVLAVFEPGEDKKLRGIFLRSASSGPDLYYNSKQARKHLLAVRAAFVGRDVIYLFNRYVLFKPAELHSFQILGTSAKDTGLNHRSDVWVRIRWSRRTLSRAFRADRRYIRLHRKPKSPPKPQTKTKGSPKNTSADPSPKSGKKRAR